MPDYSQLIQKISDRYNPSKELLVERRMFSDIGDYDKDVVKYVRLAMNEVDESYTRRVLDAGNAVKTRLSNRQNDVTYRFQGSVMTQTHIRAASDIDLLTICEKFYNSEIGKVRAEQNLNHKYTYSQLQSLRRYSDDFSSYKGNSLQDLRDLRFEDETILQSRYTHCDVTKPKSIKVHPVEYNIDVDVVIAAWFDSFEYVLHEKDETYRGIGIYNKEKDTRESPSLPFLSIKRINERSSSTAGRLKRMIRFLKNVKEDASQEINLTSFEINAICYDIPVDTYSNAHYIDLVRILWYKLWTLSNDVNVAMQIPSVDGTEKVFVKNPQRYNELTKLRSEVWSIYNSLTK